MNRKRLKDFSQISLNERFDLISKITAAAINWFQVNGFTGLSGGGFSIYKAIQESIEEEHINSYLFSKAVKHETNIATIKASEFPLPTYDSGYFPELIIIVNGRTEYKITNVENKKKFLAVLIEMDIQEVFILPGSNTMFCFAKTDSAFIRKKLSKSSFLRIIIPKIEGLENICSGEAIVADIKSWPVLEGLEKALPILDKDENQ